ncbi:hypothetical protein Tco_0371967 [Tanacetum coccineum]
MLTARKIIQPFPAPVPANRKRFYSSPSSSPRKRRRSSSSSSSSDLPSTTTVFTPADVHEPSTRVTPSTTTVDDSPAEPSRKRCRSPTTSVPSAIPAPGALSHMRADLLLSLKRFRSSSASLSPEDSTEGSIKVGSEEEDVDTDIMTYIDADIATEAVAAYEIRTKTIVGFEGDDEAEEKAVSTEREEEQRASEGRAVTEEARRARLLDRIGVLEKDNMRL